VRQTLLRGLAAVTLTSVMLVIVLAIAGHDPARALAALWNGSFGTWYAFTSGTLLRTVPLLLGGLAVAIAFRAGVMNIGVEGQLLAGATAATLIALHTNLPPLVAAGAATVAAALAGAGWAAIPALLMHRRGVLEAISTLLLNAVAVYLVGWLVRGPLQEPTGIYPQSSAIPPGARFPLLLEGTRLHAGLLLAFLLCAIVWWIFARTAAGFRLRAVGANPNAAAAAGRIDVPRFRAGVLLVSGAIGGICGAAELQGVSYALYETLSPGYGYTAIAVALLARLEVSLLIPSTLLFAALESGAGAMQRDAGVPVVLVKVVEALLILAVLAIQAHQRARDTRVVQRVAA
jgi:simple sugar transport system permease protein